jgi:hypothetical protein
MPTCICIHCALREFVKSNGLAFLSETARFNETPEEHLARCHPDRAADLAERPGLEQKAAEIIQTQERDARIRAENARNN